MRTTLLAALCLFLALALLPVCKAEASGINITRLTCGELVSMDEEAIGIIIVWIDGYYSGQHGSTSFDPDSWEGLGEMVGTACQTNPNRRVMQAIDDVIKALQGN
jgi:acid stress chaperone HdeB